MRKWRTLPSVSSTTTSEAVAAEPGEVATWSEVEKWLVFNLGGGSYKIAVIRPGWWQTRHRVKLDCPSARCFESRAPGSMAISRARSIGKRKGRQDVGSRLRRHCSSAKVDRARFIGMSRTLEAALGRGSAMTMMQRRAAEVPVAETPAVWVQALP